MMPQILTDRIGLSSSLRTQRVRTVRKRERGSFFMFLLSILILFSVVLFYLWLRLEVVKLGYDISHANIVHLRLIEENKRLKLELSRLKSPERIERIAKEQLGLHYPSGSEVRIVR